MSVLSIELLASEQVSSVWPTIESLVGEACAGNEVAKDEMDAQHVLDVLLAGRAVLFIGYEDNQPACVLVLRAFTANGHKGANVMVLAGKRILGFKSFWNRINDWLVLNNFEFLDACVPAERAHIYEQKFGFNKTCAYIRKNLVVGERSHE